MASIQIRGENLTFQVSGRVKIQGIDPDRADTVIRDGFDPDIGTMYQAEHIPTSKQGGWQDTRIKALIVLEKELSKE